MAYELDKSTGDIVVNGFEQGIQPSPHKGIANVQNANISTEVGEIIPSYVRVQDTMTNTTSTGTLSFLDSSHVNLAITGTNNLFKGIWVIVTNSSNTTQLPNGTYYVPPSTGSGFQLSNYYNSENSILPVTVTSLQVGGGGGGGGSDTSGNYTGAGGGSGQVLLSTSSVVNLRSYAVIIGGGGSGGTNVLMPTNGSSSSFNGSTSIGGGYGAGAWAGSGTTYNPSSGASGGGGYGVFGSGAINGAAGTAGNAGGNGANRSSGGAGGAGGGGGAGGVGGNGSSGSAGAGGIGVAETISGSSVVYGVGGTGGVGGSSGSAGAGFGGGGGGAGSGNGSNVGTAGNAGIVIISAPIGTITSATGGTHTTSGGNDIWTFTSSGTWIPTIATTTFPSILTGFTAGLTATIQVVATIGNPIASATEWYYSSGTPYNRYYVLDSNNLVWVYDTQNEVTYSSSDGVGWFLPDYHTNWCTYASGIGVISGFLIAATSTGLYAKSVALLGNTNSQASNWTQFPDAASWTGVSSSTAINHFVYVGHQGNLYVTDGAYVANLEPISTIADSTGAASAQNVQSFCSWTTTDANDGIFSVISGTGPSPSDYPKRIPVVFFTPNDGTLPAALSSNTVYYMQASDFGFQVYSASSGGVALDIQTGSFGTQYFNTFFPLSSNTDSISSTPLYYWQNQRLSLPVFEIAQCMAEVGNIIIIGCKSNILYPWDQVQNLPSNIIPLPESNTVNITTVHQMGYVFTGNKGNVYLTDGNVASAVTTVPDYTAGIPGTATSYIEPVFNWGASMYLRGRVYFSILDQTATKAGNTGGIWSFVPTQNLYIGQDVGISLRLENQNSYGTYNGTATVLIPKVNQNAVSPQYFSGWESSITSPLYGIDATGTTFAAKVILETDAIPTGTMLDKRTFEQIEVKLATPLLTGDSITINYRKNLTDAWKSCGAVQLQNDRLSGYVSTNFEKSQWLQLQIILNSTASFIRLAEIRIR